MDRRTGRTSTQGQSPVFSNKCYRIIKRRYLHISSLSIYHGRKRGSHPGLRSVGWSLYIYSELPGWLSWSEKIKFKWWYYVVLKPRVMTCQNVFILGRKNKLSMQRILVQPITQSNGYTLCRKLWGGVFKFSKWGYKC